jgi:transcriptional regulator with XRE-family HTH domain
MMSNEKDSSGSDSILSSLMRLTGQMAGGTLDLARNTATMTAMFGESWLKGALLNTLEPERLEAMAEAGRFLRDARETAGMSLKDLAESLGLSDNSVLENVESGESIMPLELMLRSAALLARHDPIPFLIKFMRTYNPALEERLEKWGVLSLPKNYERERRFVNIYRQHDELRNLSDDEHARFIEYMNSSTELVLNVMMKEKAAGNGTKTKSSAAAATKPKRRAKSTAAKKKAPAKKRRPSTKPSSGSTT